MEGVFKALNQNAVDPSETLYRAVLPAVVWNPETKKPSSSIFKDKRGVSVDREGERSVQEVKEKFESIFSERTTVVGMVSVQAGYCYALELNVTPDPLEKNEYHALIHNTSASKAKALIDECKIFVFSDNKKV